MANMERRKRLRLNKSAVALTVLIPFSGWYLWWDGQLPRYYEPTSGRIKASDINIQEEPQKEEEPTGVRFTSYHVGDYSGSGTVTGSGLSIDDFDINSEGWYTYEGKVVLAAATYACLESDSGACANYNELPDGYMIHGYWDEVSLFLNGTIYDGIILDSCGASFWDEPLQRYDIFVADKESVTDQVGYIKKKK